MKKDVMKSFGFLLLLFVSCVSTKMAFAQDWPPNPAFFVYFGANELGQSNSSNYAILQEKANGRTFVNSPLDIRFRIGNAERMILSNSGRFGIGTTTPSAPLEVVGPSTGTGVAIYASGGGDILLNSGGAIFFDGNYSYASGNYIRPTASNTQAFVTNGVERMRINSTGVCIGTTDAKGARLAVAGKVVAEEVNVKLQANWPDYVFEKSYNLTPLDQVKTYIDENKHLPEVPSAKEMGEKGINVSEMNMLLLKKVEELTLYVIELKEQNKRFECQAMEVEQLKEKLEELIQKFKID
jgi:hypothetical protein